MNRNDELERFKGQINLAEYAAAQGYTLDRGESSQNSAVMRRESDGDKVIVATGEDGHGIYFSVRDDADNGSIIDFVQRRQAKNLGQVRKELRPWLGASPLPVPEQIRKPERSSKDRRQVIAAWSRMEPAGAHPYLVERGLSADTLADPRFAGMIRADSRGNAVFPHYDGQGLAGYELKNREFTGFAKGGQKALWHSANIEHAPRVVVVESAIDALSHAQMTGDREAAYISIGGQMSPEQRQVLRQQLAQAVDRGAQVVAGTDADEAGDQLAQVVAEMVPEASRERPAQGQDWNEALQRQQLQMQERAQRQRRSRGHDLGM